MDYIGYWFPIPISTGLLELNAMVCGDKYKWEMDALHFVIKVSLPNSWLLPLDYKPGK